jgi:hypothetical protein
VIVADIQTQLAGVESMLAQANQLMRTVDTPNPWEPPIRLLKGLLPLIHELHAALRMTADQMQDLQRRIAALEAAERRAAQRGLAPPR